MAQGRKLGAYAKIIVAEDVVETGRKILLQRIVAPRPLAVTGGERQKSEVIRSPQGIGRPRASSAQMVPRRISS